MRDGEPKRTEPFDSCFLFVCQRLRLTSFSAFVEFANVGAGIMRYQSQLPRFGQSTRQSPKVPIHCGFADAFRKPLLLEFKD